MRGWPRRRRGCKRRWRFEDCRRGARGRQADSGFLRQRARRSCSGQPLDRPGDYRDLPARRREGQGSGRSDCVVWPAMRIGNKCNQPEAGQRQSIRGRIGHSTWADLADHEWRGEGVCASLHLVERRRLRNRATEGREEFRSLRRASWDRSARIGARAIPPFAREKAKDGATRKCGSFDYHHPLRRTMVAQDDSSRVFGPR